ncbi:MAG: hypothetical protein WD472_07910 [Dehalococcoidia bacterium]
MGSRHLTDAFSDWVTNADHPGLVLQQPRANYRVRFAGRELLYFYEANDWVYAIFKTLADAEGDHLRRTLSEPSSLNRTKKYWGCRVHSASDVSAVVELLERRVAAGS